MFVLKVAPIFTPCVLVRNQFELAAVPRVERVGGCALGGGLAFRTRRSV